MKYERKKEAVTVAKEAAQRWTGKLVGLEVEPQADLIDNTITLMQYIKSTMPVEDEQLRTMLGIGKLRVRC